MTTERTDAVPLVAMRGISKSFGENRVLFGIDFELQPGEVHALLGENGAGKSTLMKILMGVHHADEGDVRLDGEAIGARSVHDHLSRGIAMIFQELSLVPNGTVADNVFLGREPHVRGLWVDRRRMRRETERLIASLGFDLRADAEIRSLPFAQRQMVEILKAISRGARVLIMDEPTSSLTVREEHVLFAMIADLKRRGIGVIYISHRMAEIFAVADRISIVKDGRLLGPFWPRDVSVTRIAEMMSRPSLLATTTDASAEPTKPVSAHQEIVLSVSGLSTARKLRDIDLAVGAGEVVGIAGLVGSGRSTLLKALFGLIADRTGTVEVTGRAIAPGRPREAIAAGMALVPEDRRLEGLVAKHSLASNFALPNLDGIRMGGLPIASRARGNALFTRSRDALSIAATGPRQMAEQLSGGNQQKVVFGKWLATTPRLLLLDEPTSGVDVNAKAEMRRLIRDTASRGVAVLLVSSELDELVATADRIVLLIEGALVGDIAGGIDEPALRAALQPVALQPGAAHAEKTGVAA